ncbi:MAG: cysteine-rich CWC family protein [Planctomycetota bacterium]
MDRVDPSLCPLCGLANACAVAAGATRCEDCWCGGVTIAEANVAQTPNAARGRACLCRVCATMPAPAAADTEGSAEPATDPGGRPAYRLRSRDGEALVARTGAQVLSWRRADGDVLWTGSTEPYAAGKAVRGGIPIVFPWFNEHPTDRGLPAHGFARTAEWQLASLGPGARLRLTLADDERTRAMWPRRFLLALDVALADRLHVTLTVRNTDGVDWPFEEALHTYFAVGDVRTATVHGLEGVPCREHAQAPDPAWDPRAPLAFRAETDRVFQGVPERLDLRAPALARCVRLATLGARSTIVWTPWPTKAARLSGLGPDDWQRFCCVESANVREATVSLPAGAAHTLRLSLAAEP